MKFKFTKNKIIGSVLIVIVLVATFWWGGNAPGLRGWSIKEKNTALQSENIDAGNSSKENLHNGKLNKEDKETTKSNKDLSKKNDINDINKDETSEENKVDDNKKEETDKEEAEKQNKEENVNKNNQENKEKTEISGVESRPGGTNDSLTAQEKIALAEKIAKEKGQANTEKGDESYSESHGMKINPDTGKDKYLTDPVPEGKPVPVEPDNAVITDEAYTCILSVRCDTILENIDWLNPEKVELVPEDGVIFHQTKVTFYKGESVFNVLQREMKKAKIHMEFENTPIYNSAYIEGINNLYEFDCGELSGWMYKVNDWFPNYGCSRYQLKENDIVEWVYTCDLGVDVGGFSSVGN